MAERRNTDNPNGENVGLPDDEQATFDALTGSKTARTGPRRIEADNMSREALKDYLAMVTQEAKQRRKRQPHSS